MGAGAARVAKKRRGSGRLHAVLESLSLGDGLQAEETRVGFHAAMEKGRLETRVRRAFRSGRRRLGS